MRVLKKYKYCVVKCNIGKDAVWYCLKRHKGIRARYLATITFNRSWGERYGKALVSQTSIETDYITLVRATNALNRLSRIDYQSGYEVINFFRPSADKKWTCIECNNAYPYTKEYFQSGQYRCRNCFKDKAKYRVIGIKTNDDTYYFMTSNILTPKYDINARINGIFKYRYLKGYTRKQSRISYYKPVVSQILAKEQRNMLMIEKLKAGYKVAGQLHKIPDAIYWCYVCKTAKINTTENFYKSIQGNCIECCVAKATRQRYLNK